MIAENILRIIPLAFVLFIPYFATLLLTLQAKTATWRPMKTQKELSRCMKILSNYYRRTNGKGKFAKLSDDELESLCENVGEKCEHQSIYGWGAACAAYF